ncbi:MAG: Uma2 family endonuclease [Chroococcidiopsidaceae cyanobacterium CP_BM_RX_35]|nr:Uma2 family endonuclease [Chroococcidiopsidaceae cyanobacterium CP_BM_RX_35]
MNSGVRLGWMFNPQDQQVEIYGQGQPKEVCQLPIKLSGESTLPKFLLTVDWFEEN